MTRTKTKGKQPSSMKIMLMLTAFVLLGTGTIFAGINLMPVADLAPVAEIQEEPKDTDLNQERTISSVDLELESDSIGLNNAAVITIKVDGQELEITSWAETIGDLLAEQNITIDGDIINVSLEQVLRTGHIIVIVRVSSQLVYEEVAIAAPTTYKNDSTLILGKEKVQTAPRDGKKVLTYEVTYNDGIEVSRSLVSEDVVVQPVTKVVLRGTLVVASRGTTVKPPVPPSSSNEVIEGIASWYGAELHGNLTASGVPFDMYAMTAAHKTLPFGTEVKVTFIASGKSVVVVINDRGPFTPGRIIDLSAAAAKEIGLHAHGIGRVKMEILN